MSNLFEEGRSTIQWFHKEKPSVILTGISLQSLVEKSTVVTSDLGGTVACFNFMTKHYLFRGPFNNKSNVLQKNVDLYKAVDRAEKCVDLLKTSYIHKVLGIVEDSEGYYFLIYDPVIYDENEMFVLKSVRIGQKSYQMRTYVGERYQLFTKLLLEFSKEKMPDTQRWIIKKGYDILKDLVSLYSCGVFDLGYRDGIVVDVKKKRIVFCNLDRSSKASSLTTDIEKCDPHFFISGRYGSVLKNQLDIIVAKHYSEVSKYFFRLKIDDDTSLSNSVQFSATCLELNSSPLPDKMFGFPDDASELLDPTENYTSRREFKTNIKVKTLAPIARKETTRSKVAFVGKNVRLEAMKKRREDAKIIKDRPEIDIGGMVSSTKLSEYYTFSSNKHDEEKKYRYTLDVMKNAVQIYIRKNNVRKAIMCATEIWKTGALNSNHYHLFQVLIKTAYEDLAHKDNVDIIATVVKNCNYWRKAAFEKIPIEQVFRLIIMMCEARKSRLPIWLDDIVKSEKKYFKYCPNCEEYPKIEDAEKIYLELEDTSPEYVDKVEILTRDMIKKARSGKIIYFKLALLYCYLEDIRAYYWMNVFFIPKKQGIQGDLDNTRNSPIYIFFELMKEYSIYQEYIDSVSNTSGSAKGYTSILYFMAIPVLEYNLGVPKDLGEIKTDVSEAVAKYVSGDYDLKIDSYCVNSDTTYGINTFSASALRELDSEALKTNYEPEEEHVLNIYNEK